MALVEVLGFGFIILVIVVFVLYLVFPYHFVSNQTHQLINKIPGPPLTFAFGNTWEFFLEPEEFFLKMLELHGRFPEIFRIWILGKPTVVIFNPKDIEVILNSTKHIDKSHHYTFLHDWLGLGLLTSTGIKWHNRRKMLTPAFHFKILEEHVPALNQMTNILTQKLMACTSDDTPVDIHKFITLCSLDIICETAMGISVGAQEGHHNDYAHTIKRMTRLLRHRQTHVWLWRPFTFGLSPSAVPELKSLTQHCKFENQLNECLRNRVVAGKNLELVRKRLFKERDLTWKRTMEIAYAMEQASESAVEASHGHLNTDKKRLAFLDLLIALSEKDGSLSDADIREEVDTFMFEGHDTVSTAITWALYLIGIHKDIQDKLVEELDDIFHGSDRPATWTDLNNMKYMERTIKEALRIYPSVPVFARETTSIVQLGKVHLTNSRSYLIININELVCFSTHDFNTTRLGYLK
uniref:Cytochrome P450 n=1 Tax=Timema cristinae TaxID=61476 RepID=A0A7R9CCZ0_TIMCR|nr:unnamed protein product [Timema cristinae]